jgi:hypothetical protein
MDPEGSLPHSQMPANFPCPEPDEYSTAPPPKSYFINNNFNFILPPKLRSSKCSISFGFCTIIHIPLKPNTTVWNVYRYNQKNASKKIYFAISDRKTRYASPKNLHLGQCGMKNRTERLHRTQMLKVAVPLATASTVCPWVGQLVTGTSWRMPSSFYAIKPTFSWSRQYIIQNTHLECIYNRRKRLQNIL